MFCMNVGGPYVSPVQLELAAFLIVMRKTAIFQNIDTRIGRRYTRFWNSPFDGIRGDG